MMQSFMQKLGVLGNRWPGIHKIFISEEKICAVKITIKASKKPKKFAKN